MMEENSKDRKEKRGFSAEPSGRNFAEDSKKRLEDYKGKINDRLNRARGRLSAYKARQSKTKKSEEDTLTKIETNISPTIIKLASTATEQVEMRLPLAEIERKQLDQIVRAAIEVAPLETLGVLLGSFSSKAIIISDVHVIQKVFNRDRISVSLNPASLKRIKELQRELSNKNFIGGFHSHPYFDPSWIGQDRDKGLALSGADINFFINRLIPLIYNEKDKDNEMPTVEVIIAYYPWQLWAGSQEKKEWITKKAKIPVLALNRQAEDEEDYFVSLGTEEVQILARALDVEIKIRDLIPDYGRTLEELGKIGDEPMQAAVEREMELVKVKCGDTVKGFDVMVACHHLYMWEEQNLIGLRPIFIH